MDRLSKIILSAILIAAFVVRFFAIEKSPPSLNWDEASLGYSAYSILKTGKDEFGRKRPLTLRSFDDYKGAVYSYAAIPFIKAFGLSATGIRLPSVISGVFVTFLAYLYAMLFFGKKKVALLASLLVALEPWSVHFSRAAFEANLALALFLAGLYLLLRFKRYYLGSVLLVLSALTYHAEKILVFPVALLYSFLDPGTLARFSSTSIFSRYEGLFDISRAILSRYFSYFSPANLFIRGTPEPTQHIPNFGMFFPLEFFFLITGAYLLLKDYKKQKVLLLLLLVAPLPAIITWNWFYPARVLPFFFFLSLLSAYGLSKLLNKATVIPLVLLSLSAVLNLFTSLYYYLPFQEKGNWQAGMKEMVQEIVKYQDGYERVVIETKTAQPHIFLLLHSQYDPARYQEFSRDIPSPRKSFDFDKYVFREIYWRDDENKTNTLFVGPESSLPTDALSEVKDSQGNVLYKVVGIK